MANTTPSNAFPITIYGTDLADPSESRLNRAFQYIWGYVLASDGDDVPTHFLAGTGQYTTVATSSYPLKHTSAGEAGTIAYDPSGNIYFCVSLNSWVRVGPAGWSNSF